MLSMGKNKRKILIIRGENLNPWDMQMYEPLKEEFHITAVAPPQNKYDISSISLPIIKLNRIRYFFLKFLSPIKKKKRFLFYKGEFNRILYNVDIVHTAELFNNYTHAICSLKNKFHYKIISTVWENIPWKAIYSETAFEKRKFCEPLIDKIIAPTISTKKCLLLEGVLEDKITHIYPGFNLSRFKENKASEQLLTSLGLTKDDFVVLFIGRMVFQKGVFEILSAAKLLLHDPKLAKFRLKFILIGRGKEKKDVLKLLKAHGIESSFIIKNYVNYEEITKYFNLAKIFVCPSIPEKKWQEQFGMVFIESMASGVVPVGSLSGAIPEVIDNAGLLVQPGNYKDLAAKLTKLILDENLRRELKKNGLQRAKEKFDYIIQASKVAHIYHTL